jgi:dihydropyrimidine dehydrogenase (NAD+) subunit PreA
MGKCIEAGVGAVTTKSITNEALAWMVFRPRHYFMDKQGYPGSLHSVELAFRTPEQGAEDIYETKKVAKEEGVVVIGNITATGADREAWQSLAKLSQEAGADMIEILLACPHGGDLTGVAEGKVGRFLGMDPDTVVTIVKLVQEVIDIPLIVKVGAATNEALLADVLLAVERAGADILHPVAMFQYGTGAIDVETAMPTNPYGGCSGTMLRHIALTTLLLAAPIIKIPMLSDGGVSNWRDAVERVMGGSPLVGIHTAVQYRGYKAFTEVIEGIKSFMERKGYEKIEDMVGLALPNIGTIITHAPKPEPKGVIISEVDEDKCTGCERCVDACLDDAITMVENIAKIDPEICEGCGSCWGVCKPAAITLKRVSPEEAVV